MFFSDRLKQLRNENNLTQNDLAEQLQINVRTLRRYEAGEVQPNYEKLSQLASIFNVSVDYLLGKQVSAEALQKYVADLSPAELTALQEFINEQLHDSQQ